MIKQRGNKTVRIIDWHSSTKGGFHFISNVLDIRIELPLVISPVLRLQRATDTQTSIIKEHISGTSISTRNNQWKYEHEWVRLGSGGFTPRELTRADWRYFVLAYADNGAEAYRFQLAANLINPSINCVFQIDTAEPYGEGENVGLSFDAALFSNSYNGPMPSPMDRLDAATASRISNAFRKILALDVLRFAGINRALGVFQDLKRIPKGEDLYVLGLFVIIEMLLTHQPGGKETGDSLRHQVSTKIPLLSERFIEPLDYSRFKSMESEKIWQRLYDYRSCIAHGESPDFSKGSLSLLNDPDSAREFLTRTVQALLLHSLEDPNLYTALKKV